MNPENYVMRSVVCGDRWGGIPAIIIRVNNVVPQFPLASARLQFRRRNIKSPVISSLTGGIIIVSPTQWELSIPPQDLPLAPGDWKYDLETTDTAGNIKTYINGTLDVIPEVTR